MGQHEGPTGSQLTLQVQAVNGGAPARAPYAECMDMHRAAPQAAICMGDAGGIHPSRIQRWAPTGGPLDNS